MTITDTGYGTLLLLLFDIWTLIKTKPLKSVNHRRQEGKFPVGVFEPDKEPDKPRVEKLMAFF